MDRYLFDIGGRILALRARDIGAVTPHLDGFREFLTTEGDPLLTFVIDPQAPFIAGQAIDSFDLNGQVGELARTDSGWRFSVIGDDGVESYFVLDMSSRTARCNIEGEEALLNLKFHIWMAFGLVALAGELISMHSSVVVKQGAAVMFLGESGTGKSTHTSLWLKYIAGAMLLNDDSPFVDLSGAEALCCGSPWSGKGQCYRNHSYPIKAIVRLVQAPYNRISRLGTLNAIGALYPSCPPSFAYDDALSDRVFGVISKIVKAVPVYTLECLPDESAARLSYETLFGV